MSYTMTIDEPKEAAWFEETRQTMTPSEMGALFVMFLRQQRNAAPADSEGENTARQLDAFVRGLPRMSGRPYRFHRADAYEEKLA